VPEHLLILSWFEPKNPFSTLHFPHLFPLGLLREHSLEEFQFHSQNTESRDRSIVKENGSLAIGWHHYNRFVYNNTGGYLWERKKKKKIKRRQQRMNKRSERSQR